MAKRPTIPATASGPDTQPSHKQIGVRVPRRLSDKLESIARRENNSTGSVVRRLLTAALADDGNKAS
jgi:hypothetical protein